MLNPAPQTYRLTEVCLVCGSEDAYPALLARGTSLRARVGVRLRDAVTWRVEPVMTREMLGMLVSGIGTGAGLRAQWVWNGEALLSDSDAGDGGQRWLRPDAHGLYAVGAFASVGSYDWTWAEVTPPWPGGEVSASTIVGLLTTPVSNSWPIANQIKERAGIVQLAGALDATEDSRVRVRICHLIGRRSLGDAVGAVPALLELLRETDADLRSEAADAIVQIALRNGSDAVRGAVPQAHDAIITRLADEPDPRARALLAAAAGALGCGQAVPLLVELLDDRDWLVRSEAASALGALHASTAENALHYALFGEADAQAAEAMRGALAAIADTTGAHHSDPSPPAAARAAGVRPSSPLRAVLTDQAGRPVPG